MKIKKKIKKKLKKKKKKIKSFQKQVQKKNLQFMEIKKLKQIQQPHKKI